MNKLKKYIWIYLITSLVITQWSCSKSSSPDPIAPVQPPAAITTFTNPIMNGADPSVFKKDSIYYYLQTVGNSIRLWKTTAMSKLASSVPQTVFTPQQGAANSSNIWAPEIYFLDGKWYIYYTAGNGTDTGQRTWVLENSSTDPTSGTWIDKGRIYNPNADYWAIDGTILEVNNNRYFIWCGRPDITNKDLTQQIYISKMTNPWTLEGPVTRLTAPQYNWEKQGFGVNEAPSVLKNRVNDVFLVYSASYCGTDDYSLGMLKAAAGADPMLTASWTKFAEPVFTKKPQNLAYGPGHNSFFKSPDNTENWIIYHANSAGNQGCEEKRNVRIQKFIFSSDGTPILGEPVAIGLQINKPSGDK